MEKIKFAIAAGAAWLAISAGSVQAYIVDWENPFTGGEILYEQKDGKNSATKLRYDPSNGYDRSVQLWQTYTHIDKNARSLAGIAFQFSLVGGPGSIDLNVYSGFGVKAEYLISSTKLEWDTSFLGGYYAFKLDTPVGLTYGANYTIALENFMSAFPIIPFIDDWNTKKPSSYFQQGYYGGKQGDPQGYMTGISNAAINFILYSIPL